MFSLLLLTGCSTVKREQKIPEATSLPEAGESLPAPIQPTENRPIPVPLPQPQPQPQPQPRPAVIAPIVNAGPDAAEMTRVGQKIFQNETGGRRDRLVHWNHGEDFAAMGIGHFTWYPAGRRQRFGNTFPALINFMISRGAQPPPWVRLAISRGAPWYTKQEMEAVKGTVEVRQLINYLYATRGLQAEYIMARSKRAMQKFVNTTPAHLKERVAWNINSLAETRGGWYPLIDYVNFKGEGLNRHGGYNGQNWGMLQVLEMMQPSQPGRGALAAFADAAYTVLARRVRNSPPKAKEGRWLPGWTNRVNTYRGG